MNQEGCGKKQLCLIFRYYPSIYLPMVAEESDRKLSTAGLHVENQILPSKYKTEVLTTLPGPYHNTGG
jgi:hypothetical protein